jgi:tRNA threonylcarbamoyl adenosine modification protein YeaZ
VILAIDTSGPLTAWAALVDGDSAESHMRSSREITRYLRELIKGKQLTAVAVGTGPGSFTGLRVGVSFGLGLAMGLRIPIIPLPSLDLWAARVEVPATAVIEAGRGRIYFQVPGGRPQLGVPAGVPASHPLVGNVTPATRAALVAARHRFLETDVWSFGRAAQKILESAREVPYGSLEIEYMQTFSAPR